MGWPGVGSLAGYFFSRSQPSNDSARPDSTSTNPADIQSDSPLSSSDTQDLKETRDHGADVITNLAEERDLESPQSTPKASASNAPPPVLAVPTLSLNGDASNGDGNVARTENARKDQLDPSAVARVTSPSSEARINHATSQSPGEGRKPPTSLSTTTSNNTLSPMPPPPVPRPRQPPQPNRGPPTLQPPRSSASSLRAPPSAAASLRAPATSGGLSSSTLAPTTVKKQASRKVILEPGYSPLDWAARTSNPNNGLRGVGLPAGLVRVTPSMLKMQNGRKGRDAWTSYQGKVYNISPYAPYHPGGKGELLRGAGKDSAQLFAEIHPWVNWDGILGECLVGILVSEHDPQVENGLDAMD
ncbi:Uncharacterized protein PECH_008375 [Penicillium ucsense]|uniref:Cytochrome b5 heme-binding domain-containing protein n=1 Tax=Penicillium ucsense TaxID=2839758 RepID=A0A8J8W7H6_9EURO|nr:Uncharacterized protein PECM_002088 [Penicillium ucsense]KAF7734201.1 Uncharacterized protein PECH_008375 [Penicillium ucsense]